jgi:NAD(P)-dependent dehydrogenase (short-subunit alcohol dehydrogenase family)
MTEDHFSVAGTVAVVTGGTRGIGRAVAGLLGQAGAHIVVVGRATRDNPHQYSPGTVEDTVEELSADGVDVLGISADLSDPAGVARIIEETMAWKGRCDVLVNNAAYTSNGPILDIPARRWQSAFHVQVTAPLQMCQAFLPGMFERGAGRVLNVSSGASQSLTGGLALYSVSKLAMERWNEYMQLELGGRGVSFNTLRVDQLVPTEGWKLTYDLRGEDVATGGKGLSEMVSPLECGEFMMWMLTQPASWTGQTVGFHDLRRLQRAPA